jgi:glyoxalase family protein
MQLTGIHHLTAITADARGNHDFFTRVLGLRMVKKTVNQDDTSAYHLFYADGEGRPGSDITFFDWPAAPEKRGTHSIVRTALRIHGQASFDYWVARLKEHGVKAQEVVTRDGRMTLDFEDAEGQRLSLVDDGGQGSFAVWEKSEVPAEHQIRGLGPITMSVPDITRTKTVLTDALGMREERTYESVDGARTHVFAMGEGGASAELHVAVEPDLAPSRQGAGAVHHVAFRIPDEAYDHWAERLSQLRLPSSGPVDRFYFRSLYFREPNGILFEIATDGPGFHADEPMETMGEGLSLPPFLEPRRAEIEAGLKPL